MKYIILAFNLFILLSSCNVLGQQNSQRNDAIRDSLFQTFAKTYYAEHLRDVDLRDLKVSTNGYTTISVGNKSHRVYKVLVTYSIYKNDEWFQTHYKKWYWDLKERKCYWYSDYSQKRKPGEPYQGLMTSACYIDVTNESFAQNGFKILDSEK